MGRQTIKKNWKEKDLIIKDVIRQVMAECQSEEDNVSYKFALKLQQINKPQYSLEDLNDEVLHYITRRQYDANRINNPCASYWNSSYIAVHIHHYATEVIEIFNRERSMK